MKQVVALAVPCKCTSAALDGPAALVNSVACGLCVQVHGGGGRSALQGPARHAAGHQELPTVGGR